jgi:sugar phosphate permease
MVCLSSSAAAQTTKIRLDKALQLALDNSPSIRAARTQIEQSKAQEITAGLRPNPLLSWDSQFVPFFDPSLFSTNTLDTLQERATISAIFDSAGKFGGAVGMPLVVWMISLMGWRMCFAVLGAIGVVWSVAWWLFFSETPDKHKMVSAEEVRYIYEGQRLRHGASGPAPMRWYELLRYRNIWAMCLGFFTINYISYFFITWLPTYLVKEKGMGMMAMGFVASLPLLAGMLAEVVAGILSDRVAHSKRISLTATRKIFLIAGLTMALCIGIAPFSHSLVFTVALLCIAKAGTTTAASQVWALPGDVSPRNMTSTVAGLQNMVSNFGGVVGPVVTGFIVSTTGSFNAALMFSGLIGLVGILIYSFLLTTVEPITC